MEILWAPATGGAPHYVISTPNRGSSRKMPRLTWSPDGSRIFYDEDEQGPDTQNTLLVSVRPDGTDRQVHLTIPYAEEIVPSPDGRWVVYSRLHEGFLSALPELGKDPWSPGRGPAPRLPLHPGGGGLAELGADGGKTLTWGFGPEFYRVALEDVRNAWEAEKAKAAKKSDPAARPRKRKRPGAEEEGRRGGQGAPGHPGRAAHRAPGPPHRYLRPSGRPHHHHGGRPGDRRGTVVMRDDRIAAVGPEDAVTVPAGAKVFDVSGKTIMPGLVDVHAHLHYELLDIIPENDCRTTRTSPTG